ncbi:MAG: VOC family protein [Novosphingobium sp.]|nr:VOC family protein [Novosphingobium sp.]
MKRLHVHLSVSDLDQSIAFYSGLFGSEPGVRKADYARWLIDEPAVNFAISDRACGEPGVSHLGIQAGDDDDLALIEERIAAASGPVENEGETTCCYARSRKSWTADPDGLRWEAFLTHGESETFGAEPDLSRLDESAAQSGGACCDSAA